MGSVSRFLLYDDYEAGTESDSALTQNSKAKAGQP